MRPSRWGLFGNPIGAPPRKLRDARVTKPQTSPTLMIQFIDSMNAYQHSSPADRAKISLLDITVPLLPRGKKLRDCTGAEVSFVGKCLTDLSAIATTPERTRVIQEFLNLLAEERERQS